MVLFMTFQAQWIVTQEELPILGLPYTVWEREKERKEGRKEEGERGRQSVSLQ